MGDIHYHHVSSSKPNYELDDDLLENKYEAVRGDRPIAMGLGAGFGALAGLSAPGRQKVLAALLGAAIGSAVVGGGSAAEEYMLKREMLRRKNKKSKKEKTAMAFLSQNRPEAVKKIYRALKREHPEMPAEMKARIAARQGKPGKQHQGPPYKGPLSGEKEKRAFLQGQPQAVMVAQQRMTEVWAQLEAMALLYQDGHWKAFGLAQNGDHELFGRLYSRCQKALDEIAEKIHGYFGNQGFSLPAALGLTMQGLQQLYATGEDHVNMGLAAEDQFQAILKGTHEELSKLGVLPLGLDDWLMSTASDFDVHSYMLQQRSAQGAMAVKTAANTNVQSLSSYLKHFQDVRGKRFMGGMKPVAYTKA